MRQQRQAERPWIELASTQSETAAEPFRIPTIVDFAVRIERSKRERMILENVRRTNALRESTKRTKMVRDNKRRTAELRTRMAGKMRALCCPCGRRNGCRVTMRVVDSALYSMRNSWLD